MRTHTETEILDAVIVGGGAAGLSAALVLGRARRTVAVIDYGKPRNAPAAHMHGFLSRDGIPPGELLTVGRSESQTYGVEFKQDDVVDVSWRGIEPGFVVELSGCTTLETRTVLVATGLRDSLPEIPGIQELWGRSVLHCPYCHAYEISDQPIGILGGDAREMSLHQAFLLRQWSSDVMFFPHHISLTPDERARLAAHGVTVVDGPVSGLIRERGELKAVEFDNGQLVARSALFVAPRFIPNDTHLTRLGCKTGPTGFVAVAPSGATSVPGVWGAGNVVDPRAQVIGAAAAGSTAAIAINGYLVEQDVESALRSTEPEGGFSAAVEQRVCQMNGGSALHGM
ncbi:NAD(P)/FAD-dependent oxidoreductase [Rhodococcus erythropolis]|nr:NAD(P)/FAD-dependent oxidoreductase [Rhodococcus erythropolis]MDV6277014.1 NAD(P)/FAD-dependent oxidoreductase [Rhodococcus erythropolis]